MKRNKPIGFVKDKSENDSELPDDFQIEIVSNHDFKAIETILSKQYISTERIEDADELITTLEIQETVSQNISCSRNAVFKVLEKMNFKSTSIDGQIYWLIKYNA